MSVGTLALNLIHNQTLKDARLLYDNANDPLQQNNLAGKAKFTGLQKKW